MCECFDIGRRKVMMGLGASLLLPLSIRSAIAQSILIGVRFGCSLVGNKLPTEVALHDPSYNARRVVDMITDTMGQVGFDFSTYAVRDSSVKAFATTVDGERLVLYEENFFEPMVSEGGYEAAALAVLAHEVGHHYIGHTLDESGSRPPRELEADRFAGYIVGWHGHRLEDALSLYQAMPEEGTGTHPPRLERIAYLRSGWEQALGNRGDLQERFNLISHTARGDGGYRRILVEFVQEGNRWNEYQNGKFYASFVERSRTGDAIYLYDASRTLWLWISEIDNLARLSVGYHGQGTYDTAPDTWHSLDPLGWR